MVLIGIIVSIIIFSIIILAHEFGHFKTARIFGVKVEEFGLGIPPKVREIFIDKHGTKYTLNWLPLGGFVRLKGENINTFNLYNKDKKIFDNYSLEKAIKENSEIFDYNGNIILQEDKIKILEKLKDNYAKDSLLTKSYWKQAIIILAGIFMNFLLAGIIFSVLFFIGVSPVGINDKIQIDADIKLIPTPVKASEIGLIKDNSGVYLLPIKDSIAKISGIKDYDLVLKVNNLEIKNYIELKNTISLNPNKKLNLEIKRSKNNCDISKTDKCNFENIILQIIPNNEGKIGSYLIPNSQINKDFKYKYGFLDSIKYGFKETYGQIILTFKGLKLLAKNIFNPETPKQRDEAISQISGPIGMVDFMTKSIGNGIIFIIIFGAIISINLGVFNLLPIPALDGGRFLFILINGIIKKVFGKKAINENIEGLIHILFFIFLIALSVIIAYNDVHKIITN
ncbi:MAG: site-2 protease family protein [Candidatus Gracilibacteria bacterium]|nr:site-2 protease family protein [Candidatus Gracilibacteria bacterium]